MAYVEGTSLNGMIGAGPLKPGEELNVATHVAVAARIRLKVSHAVKLLTNVQECDRRERPSSALDALELRGASCCCRGIDRENEATAGGAPRRFLAHQRGQAADDVRF
jgi:hypothetical protein